MKVKNRFFIHLALWLPLVLVTPVITAIKNPDDFSFSLVAVVFFLLLVTFILSLTSFSISHVLKGKAQKITLSIILAFATAITIQGYIVHDLFQYGQLDGHEVNWSNFGWIYWAEVIFFFIFTFLISILYKTIPNKWQTISFALILFSCLQLVLIIPTYIENKNLVHEQEKIDSSVFEFSSNKNIIHILADGFQADIVKQVLEENPELKKEFSGFIFFENHLGHFQSTAPTIPSIVMGEIYNLDEGYKSSKVKKMIEKKAYTNELFEAGYKLDFTPVSTVHCTQNARNCVNRSFNDLKSRGYITNRSLFSNLVLLLDISLFRHSPMLLKEQIYNNGSWLLSSKTANDWSPDPDPVIREWIDNMKVSTSEPIYKWYHFIGTHIPAQWNSRCEFIGRQPQEREYYVAQSKCVLIGLANLIKKLKKEKIYNKTILVINGDHGCNIAANDLFGESKNYSSINDNFIGVTRPLFMIKPLNANENLKYNETATTLEDIAPTILNLAKIETQRFKGKSVFLKTKVDNKARTFDYYLTNTFWSGEPVAYTRYEVNGEIRNRANWKVKNLKNRRKAPTGYDHFSYKNAFDLSNGLSLRKGDSANQKETPIYGLEYYILVSDIKEKASKLTMSYKIPNKITKQSISIEVNGQTIIEDSLLGDSNMQLSTREFSIPNGLLLPENNLFKFVLSKKGSVGAKISFILSSIKLH
jgi:hypothetical protein